MLKDLKKVRRELRSRRHTLIRKCYVVPGQSMSVNEIVARFARGLPLSVESKHAVYNDGSVDDDDLESLSRLDFAEKAERAQQLRDELAAIKAEAEERAKQRAIEKAEAKRAADESKRRNERSSNSQNEKKASGQDADLA